MSEKNAIEFVPYRKFRESQRAIDEFEQLTDLAYGITQQLLFRHAKDDLSGIVIPDSPHKDLSFCMGDREIASVHLTCEWVTLDEYARRTSTLLEEVSRQASEGLLGPITHHPNTGEEILLWPPETQKRPLEQLPEPGKKIFTVQVAITARAPLAMELDDIHHFDEVQRAFLTLAHSMGKPEEVGERAKEVLYRSCLVLRWTAFEVFLRAAIHDLFRSHPHKLAKDSRAKRPSMSYADIISMSEQFTSIEALQTALVERQIEQSEAEGQSIHGLINLLKSSFAFHDDPYEAWYVLRGQRHETDYNTLLEIKEVRNALVHDGGYACEEFFDRFPNVPHRDNQIVIDDAYNTKTALVFGSVAYKIANSVVQREYHAS